MVSLCGERNGVRGLTYTEQPGRLLGPGFGGQEEREVMATLSLDRLWPTMEAPGAQLLAKLLEGSVVGVEGLSATGNSLGGQGCAALTRALPGCWGLRVLDLRMNGVGDEGAMALAKVLPQLSTLEVLRLGGNHIGDRGASALAEALSRCKVLTELGLSENLISDAGAQALSASLTQSSLRTLELDGNSMGAKGRAALGGAKLPAMAMDVWTTGPGVLGPRRYQ